jgi:D-3-phosphoglycerate dehydrogenase / 2-oxoglutarate reductase
MKVLVAETIAETGIDRLRSEATVDVLTDLTREQLLEKIGGYDALIIRSQTKADAELIAKAANLKVIGRAGIGLDNVDLDAATRHGIVVVNAPTSNVLSAAEHTIALMLSLARHVPSANASLKAGKWERDRFEGVELHGKTLAILGLGRIGTLVAQRALALGMRVVAFDPYVAKQRAGQMGVELAASLDDALGAADFVTIHLPKTSETQALIGERELGLLKPTARIVNTSRGGIVDEAALASAIEAGRLGGAALDVFAKEPPDASSPLFGLEQVVVTPHLGASTEEAQEKAGVAIAEQVLLALRGELAPYAVNVEAGRELSDVVRPFLPLAEKLGRIFTALAGGHFHEVRFSYQGQIADHDTRVLTLAALKGMFSGVVHETVTFVNAPIVAAERGIEVTEEKSAMSRDYVNAIEISAEGAAVAGTLVGKRNEERLVRVLDFDIDFPPGPFMCFLRYDDRPGVIGAIGTILGRSGVNIADMRVGRQEKGGEALMCLAVDQSITPEVLKDLADGSDAKDAKFVVLE